MEQYEKPIDIITPVTASDSDFLYKAADSVARQELMATQYVIGPGVDELRKCCKQYEHIKLLEHNNLSVSAARNIGIEAGNAPIIQFLDADDYLKQGHLNKVQNRLSKTDLTWTNMELKGDKKSTKQLPEPGSASYFFKQFLAVPLSALALRRAVLGDIRFRPDIELGEGIDFVAKLLQDSDATKIEKPGVVKRVRDESLSVSMGFLTRLWYQTRTAVGIAKEIPACRTTLPIVLAKILYRISRDAGFKIFK